MEHTALLLLGLALALLPHAVQADRTADPVCVQALEQLETLQTAAPVYKLWEVRNVNIWLTRTARRK
jgi:hypothetical protein